MEATEKKKENVVSLRLPPEYYANVVQALVARGHYKSAPELCRALLNEAALREGIKPQAASEAAATPKPAKTPYSRLNA